MKIKIRLGSGNYSGDFSDMLARMYKRYAAKHGYEILFARNEIGNEIECTVNCNDDEVLACQGGVHRLVHIPSGDSRRHTVFALVFVDDNDAFGDGDKIAYSYILAPYQLAKNHQDKIETENAIKVLDGDIELLFNQDSG